MDTTFSWSDLISLELAVLGLLGGAWFSHHRSLEHLKSAATNLSNQIDRNRQWQEVIANQLITAQQGLSNDHERVMQVLADSSKEHASDQKEIVREIGRLLGKYDLGMGLVVAKLEELVRIKRQD